ncbi:MAG: CoA-binding protein [Nitrososphaeria archaeon]
MAILNKDKELEKVLVESKVVAVVGLSRSPEKDSYIVAKYLSEKGYRIISINPNAEEVSDWVTYPSLLAVPEYNLKDIDIINVFRPGEELPEIARQACELKRKYGKPNYLWMQIGISNLEAAKIARECGIDIVMNRCIMMEYKRLCPKV